VKQLLVFCLFFVSFQMVKAAKTDTIYMKNGDRITCEIKELEFGKVRVKTDDVGIIYIEWDAILSLHTTENLEIQFYDGERLFGPLTASEDTGTAIIHTPLVDEKIYFVEVVGLMQIKNGFFAKIDGSIEAGLSYTRGSETFQANFNAKADYRGRNYLTGIRTNTITTIQSDRQTQENQDHSAYFRRMFLHNYFAEYTVSIQRNTTQGLGRRTITGFLAGKDLLRKSRLQWNLSAGVLFNNEQALDSVNSTNSGEAVFSTMFKVVKYNSPKRDIYTQVSYFPSITEKERYRVQYDLNMSLEIFSDFHFTINYYYMYDSKPRTESALKDDFGIVTGIKYTF
jgi:hypothetical protein